MDFNLKFRLVVAVDQKNGISKGDEIPWKVKEDMVFFRKTTTGESKIPNAVVMGRRTWDSIPKKPLKNRINVVFTRNRSKFLKENVDYQGDELLVFESLEKMERILYNMVFSKKIHQIFVIGGKQIYDLFLNSSHVEEIYITRIGGDFGCDLFFTEISPNPKFEKEDSFIPCVNCNENASIPFIFERYANVDRNKEEKQYLSLVSSIIESGFEKNDRTGVGTFSKLGVQMRYDLRNDIFPLLTTKKTFFRGIKEELLWFIQGDTYAKNLSEKGVKIWDSNGSREFLDQRGLSHYEKGDLGPVYGFQWRHFGAKYEGFRKDYSGKGTDQLHEVIKTLKTNPNSRRIIMSAWNPSQLNEMALPPCHLMCQFFVVSEKFLSCLMYQRSADMGLGVPFNIASYALLTCMIAQVCDLEPLEFIHCIGDAHVYKNHVEPLKEQIRRIPRSFPILKLNKKVKNIDDFKSEDIEIIGYEPFPTIKMRMAV